MPQILDPGNHVFLIFKQDFYISSLLSTSNLIKIFISEKSEYLYVLFRYFLIWKLLRATDWFFFFPLTQSMKSTVEILNNFY